MPLPIVIPAKDLFLPKERRFVTTKETHLKLEHSLLSISKWEAKWHKAYLGRQEKTEEESLDYLRCMCLTQNVDPDVFYALTKENVKEIADYIQNPMTATTIKKDNKPPSREIITSELLYWWMADFGIPFDPCEKWHLNRLLTLIQVASVKSQPGKKMSTKDILKQNTSLNAARRARLGSRG